jgi:phosphopantothenoylcysteine decarboxylase/phosphopantothenate--cysteine ligase
MSKRILFQLSGSIACYKACMVISRLIQDGFEVQTACTANALRFIGPATLEGLTGKPVFTDAYEAGRMMDHIHLAKWADLAILCPATANSTNQLAAGIATDGVGSLFLAWDLKKPYLLAPAMNQEMFRHPATQQSISKLQSWNVQVLGTGHGRQACGDIGPGRLLEPEKIHAEILKALDQTKERNPR